MPRYPWAVRAGGPLLIGGGGAPIDPTITFTWDTENGQALPGGTTFTRASVKQEFDGTDFTELSSGAIPENSAAVGGGAQGFNPEPAATNLLAVSTPNETDWSAFNQLSLTSQGIGAIGLEVVRMDAGGGASTQHGRFEGVVGDVQLGNDYAFSTLGKDVTGTFLALRGDLPSSAAARFNVATGAIASADPSATANITSRGNGWSLCEIAWTGTGTATSNVILATDNSGGLGSVPRNYPGGNEQIDVVTAQVEETLFSTSPIITTGSTLTRLADVLDTGIAVTTEFSALLDVTLPIVIGAGNTITLLGPDATPVDILLVDAANDLIMDDGGTPVTIGAVTPGTRIKVAYGRDAAGRSASLDGATAVTGGAPDAGHVGETIELGSRVGVNQSRCIHHLSTLFNVKKSDAELEALSS